MKKVHVLHRENRKEFLPIAIEEVERNIENAQGKKGTPAEKVLSGGAGGRLGER